MPLTHHHVHRARSTFHDQLKDYIDRDSRFAEALAEDPGPILDPRYAQSSDNYGSASGGGSSGGSGSGSSGSSGNYGSSSSSGSSSSEDNCGSGALSSTCTATSTSTTTIPVVLGVVIPVAFFTVAMLVIWRVKKKRDRIERAADKHGSLDFGLGEMNREERRKRSGKNKRGHPQPEMTGINAEKQFRKDGGLSMDMGSPYVLPADMVQSRPSLSRSAHDQEDPYRPVALARTESPTSLSRPATSGKDSASLFTQSSDPMGARSHLVQNAYSPSNTDLPSGETPLLGPPQPSSPLSPPPELSGAAYSVSRKPIGQGESSTNLLSTDTRGLQTGPSQETSTGSQEAGFDFNLPPATDSPLPTFQFTEDTTVVDGPYPHGEDAPLAPPPRSSLRGPSPEHTNHDSAEFDEYTTYADVLGIVQKESAGIPYNEEEHGLGVQGVETGSNRLSASIRPLPPDDPLDNPEDRANRIRSFYREYFDEKRGTVAGGENGVDYYEDYNQEYLDGATIWDPQTGQFVVSGGDRPYAHNVTRRAMTPPPRAPPRFRQGSKEAHRMHGSGGYGPGRLRGYSSASANMRGREPKRPAPPPSPLNNLPTPHLLRDDSAIFNANEFAPPSSYKERVSGRPDSPMADKRPYSPSVRAFTPLASSFDDLRVMPSPHALRRSGTFTGLDFAPPPRINTDSASDAVSIRSGRSTSSRQLANIRAGAYRVSRLPGEFVGTRNDFAQALKPSWDQRGPSTGV